MTPGKRKAPLGKVALASLVLFMPQPIKRWIYQSAFGWTIHPTAQLGFSYILVDNLIVEAGVRVHHGNVIKGCEFVQLKKFSRIGSLNWISAPPFDWAAENTKLTPNRRPYFVLGRRASILHRHLIDCSDSVTLGDGAVLAGYRSQLLTHYFDVADGSGKTAPIQIGDKSLVFTSVVLLAGASVPGRSVVAAGAVVTGRLAEELYLYGGVPARKLKPLAADCAYFDTGE